MGLSPSWDVSRKLNKKFIKQRKIRIAGTIPNGDGRPINVYHINPICSGSLAHEVLITELATIFRKWGWWRQPELPYWCDAVVDIPFAGIQHLEFDTGSMSEVQVRKRWQKYTEGNVLVCSLTPGRVETMRKWSGDLGDRVTFMDLETVSTNPLGDVFTNLAGVRFGLPDGDNGDPD